MSETVVDPVLEAVDQLARLHDAETGGRLGPRRVLKAVVVAELLDERGDRCLELSFSGEATEWDVAGMLHHALRINGLGDDVPD